MKKSRLRTFWSRTAGRRAAIPLEEKESYRWVVALRRAHEEALRHPQTQIICVADSEADIYELLAEGGQESQAAQWIVRAGQNRALQPSANQSSPAYLR